MSSPRTPLVVRGGLVVVDPDSSQVRGVIPLQYNPDTLSRSLQVQGTDGTGNRSEALRLKGPAVETLKIEVEIDATDQLEKPAEGQNRVATEVGIHPQLAMLEALINPTTADLLSGNASASMGSIEILPAQRPLVLFVWGKQRITPVRITEMSITEEAFDPALNPIRAKVSLGMRALSVDDLGFAHKGGVLHMAHLATLERLAGRGPRADLGALGLGGLP